MLGDHKMRKIVNDYYEDSGEQELVRKAVSKAWSKENQLNSETDGINTTGTLLTKFQTLRYSEAYLKEHLYIQIPPYPPFTNVCFPLTEKEGKWPLSTTCIDNAHATCIACYPQAFL